MKAAILSLKTDVGLRRGGRRKEEREDEEEEVPTTGERASFDHRPLQSDSCFSRPVKHLYWQWTFVHLAPRPRRMVPLMHRSLRRASMGLLPSRRTRPKRHG